MTLRLDASTLRLALLIAAALTFGVLLTLHRPAAAAETHRVFVPFGTSDRGIVTIQPAGQRSFVPRSR